MDPPGRGSGTLWAEAAWVCPEPHATSERQSCESLPKPMLSARHPPPAAYLPQPHSGRTGSGGSFPLAGWHRPLGSEGAAGDVTDFTPGCSVLSSRPLTCILQAGGGAGRKQQSRFDTFTFRKMHLTFLLGEGGVLGT